MTGCQKKSCGCSPSDLFGPPGEGLNTGAIPFIVGDPVTGEFRQADLQEYIPQSEGLLRTSQWVSVNSDGTSPVILATTNALAPFARLRIRGTLRVNNTHASLLRVTLSLPADNAPNSGRVS